MSFSVLRRGAPAAAVAAVLVLGVAACGTERADSTGAQPTTANPKTPTPSGKPTGDSDMPHQVILKRSGGFAGFMDEIVVEPSGAATLKTRGKSPLRCRVAPDLLARITAATDVAASTEAPKKGKSKGWKTTVPDELHLTLIVGDQTVRYRDLDKSAESWRDLFGVLSDVLDAAKALQQGKSSPDSGLSCSE